MQKYLFLMCIIIILNCYGNQIKIEEIYIRSNGSKQNQSDKNLIYKELKSCTTRWSSLKLGGKLGSDFEDEYDKKLNDVLKEAFLLSGNTAWYNVEIYNDQNSCKVLRGYYYAQ